MKLRFAEKADKDYAGRSLTGKADAVKENI